MNLRTQANQATITEAAEILGIKVATIYAAIRRGYLPVHSETRLTGYRHGVRPRRVNIVDLEDVEVWNLLRTGNSGSIKPLGDCAAEVARERGISTRSAARALQREQRRAG